MQLDWKEWQRTSLGWKEACVVCGCGFEQCVFECYSIPLEYKIIYKALLYIIRIM